MGDQGGGETPRWVLGCGSTRCGGAAETRPLPHPRELTLNQKLDRCQETARCRQNGDDLNRENNGKGRGADSQLPHRGHGPAPPPETRI